MNKPIADQVWTYCPETTTEYACVVDEDGRTVAVPEGETRAEREERARAIAQLPTSLAIIKNATARLAMISDTLGAYTTKTKTD